MAEAVILVPGVGLGGAEMGPLAWRLKRRGFEPRVHLSSPWRRSVDEEAAALNDTARDLEQERIHFVGHSYGGLIIARLFQAHAWRMPGRVVTLATPHNGSVAAGRVARLPLGPGIIGKGLTSALDRGVQPLPEGRDWGGLAGRLDLTHFLFLGLFRLLPSPNDTLVCVEETRHAQMRDHAVLFETHASLLVSAGAADLVDRFLRTGCFGR